MNESQVFNNALKLATPAERAAYLDEACDDDPAFRAAVEALLRAQASDPDFLEQPAGSATGTVSALAVGDRPTSTADPGLSEQPGMVLTGRYKLLEEIGEGGMGTVWMAQQTEPVKRTVAVKLIKRGMDTRQVLARFEAERQALALMDHPNISKVHDAGVTQDGRPFFVMELVKGVPITKFCDEHRLTPRQRLELFVPVCHAIQHAHQKGVIHRDLKPSNVLVAVYDDRPVPKVIDFGVAKATGQQLTERTLHTGFGAVVGTVEYMSPEQATFNQLDIDTRSDVYSLGVLLYELLTGSPPFSKKDLEEAGMLEMLRVIREKEPSKPSAKLSTADGLPTLAVNRGTEPKKLMKEVRGELDWIVMKALEKDRSRRYDTANSLARDLQHYLADEVVEARPPGAGYRVRKFVKRNRGPVVAASLIVLLLLSGIAGTTIGLVTARHERDEAEGARKDEAREAARAIAAEQLASNRLSLVESEKRRADEERDVAKAVNDFLQELLGQVDAFRQPGGPAAEAYDPDIKVRTVVDRAAKSIGARFANKPRIEAAIRLTIAGVYWGMGNWPEARLHAERSVELRTASLGPDHADTLASKLSLAETLSSLFERKRAEALVVEVLERRTANLGPDHFDTLTSKAQLAKLYSADPARLDRAVELLQDVVNKQSPLFGLATLDIRATLAWAYRLQGKFGLAAEMYEDLLKAYTNAYGADRPPTLLIRSNLGLIYAADGKFDQAKLHLEYVLAKRTSIDGEDSHGALTSKGFLADMYLKQGNYDRAALLFEQNLARYKEKSYSNTPFVLGQLIRTRLLAKQPEKAQPLLGEYFRAQSNPLWDENPLFAIQLETIGRLLLKNEQYVEAEKALRQSLAVREKKQPDVWSTFDIQARLGAALLGQKKFADAGPLLLKGYQGMKQREEKIPESSKLSLTEALERLVQLYDAWGKPDEAAKWRKELEAYKKSAEKTAKPKGK